MLEREYLRESLTYVLQIQEVQERIKFEFVETVVGFMQGWLTFYHSGHEVAEDTKDYINDLLQRVQKVTSRSVVHFVHNINPPPLPHVDTRELSRDQDPSGGVEISIYG